MKGSMSFSCLDGKYAFMAYDCLAEAGYFAEISVGGQYEPFILIWAIKPKKRNAK